MDKSRSLGTPFCTQAPQLDAGEVSTPTRNLTINLDLGLANLKTISAREEIKLLQKALGNESKLHLVGGTVRDSILGNESVDIDLACAQSAETTSKKLRIAAIKVVETGKRHGTITAVFGDLHIEITAFRRPLELSAQKPGSSIEEDLSARDFTINAIAFALDSQTIVDPFLGLRDLQANVLKAVGSADDRFHEDPLRVMRALRFGPAQSRTMDSNTWIAAKKAAPNLRLVSIERVRMELERILLSTRAGDGLRAAKDIGILEQIIPEILPTVGFEQNRFHIHDVFEHTLWVIDRSPLELPVRVAALFHDLGKPPTLSVDEQGNRHFFLHEKISEEMCKARMKELRFSNEMIDQVSTLVRLHMRPLDCGAPGVRRLLRDLGPYFDDWIKLKQADKPPVESDEVVAERLHRFLGLVSSEQQRLAKSGGSKLAIGGDDLIALGFQAGRRLGEVLKHLEEVVIENPEANTSENLLQKAKQLL